MEINKDCPVCGKEFSTVLHLDHHFLAEHKQLDDGVETNQLRGNNVKYACYKCDWQFIEKYQLKIHSREGCAVSYFCKQCRFKTTQEDYLKEHEQSKHETIKYCDMSNFISNSQHLLAKHIRYKHTKVEMEIKGRMLREGSKWYCTDCDFKAKSKTNVYYHVESNHIFHGGHPCHLCGSVAKTKPGLRQHYSKYHRQ